MLSNLVLQDTIKGIKTITKCDLTVVGLDGKVIASTRDDVIVNRSDVISFAESQADSQEIRDMRFFKVFDDYQLEYILVASGLGHGREDGRVPDSESSCGLQGAF